MESSATQETHQPHIPMNPETRTPRLAPRRAAPARTATLLVLFLAALPGAAGAAPPPSLRGPIATVGDRTVEAIDIQRAAALLGDDPLRKKSPAQWRRKLLDRCVDRELLAIEAERRGIAQDPAIRQRIAEREYLHLFDVIDQRVLAPTLEPTAAEVDSLKRSGLYRMMDLHFILVEDDPGQTRRKEAEAIVARLRQGARFDSVARIKSAHPSRMSGGHFGPVLVRDLEPESYAAVRTAKPGDVLGPYSGTYGHQIYKVGGFQILSDDSIRSLVRNERQRNLIHDYQERLLKQYHFVMDTTMAHAVIFATGLESPDSILASLGPDGRRPRRGVHPALGLLARIDGDSLTFVDLIRETHPAAGAGGRIRIADEQALRLLEGQAFFRRLLVRDAKDRGLADDPRVAHELRLIRDGTAVDAMVSRERPPDPDDSALRAYFEANASRYQLPAGLRARVAVFADRESALVSLRAWNGIGISDSSLKALGFEEQPRATAQTLYPQHAATILFRAGDSDPLAMAMRSLDPGRTSPVVRTAQGYAVAHVLAREPARPMTLDEAIDRVRRDWREEKENEWVLSQVERMRASVPVRVVPARLDAVKLGPAKAAGSPANGAATASEASR